jgi:hypothetical protein
VQDGGVCRQDPCRFSDASDIHIGALHKETAGPEISRYRTVVFARLSLDAIIPVRLRPPSNVGMHFSSLCSFSGTRPIRLCPLLSKLSCAPKPHNELVLARLRTPNHLTGLTERTQQLLSSCRIITFQLSGKKIWPLAC